MLWVVACLLYVACRSSCVVCCLLWCVLFVVCCLLFDVCRVLLAAGCLLFVVWLFINY